ncbi:serine hydrolase domain-containing protein [Sagittula sp. S175]|uniref:serine hydrolase domain-containing protein n=1 Tax=Sagittula sp. S175 TaxID=3415129 RepID=UPI003C799570
MKPRRISAGLSGLTVVPADQNTPNARVEALAADHLGAAVAIVSPFGMVSSAAGDADPDGRVMTPGTPIRIASHTKSFTAAAILRLWETGRFDLDAPIGALIPAAQIDMFRAGGYDPNAITVRPMLLHSSGPADHAKTVSYQAAVFADPGRIWTRADQLAVLREATEPTGLPGARFHFSDTGYAILGGIVERQTGLPLGQAVRDLLRLDETAMRWKGELPADGAARAHPWIGETNTFAIHGSIDAHGGGGIVARVEATARAYAALIGGSVFDDPQTLEVMLAAPDHPEGSPYRMEFHADHLDGVAAYRHAGFWGIEALALPKQRLVIVATVLNHSLRELVDRLALDWIQ